MVNNSMQSRFFRSFLAITKKEGWNINSFNKTKKKFKRSELNLSNAAEAIYIYHQLIDLGAKLGVIRYPSETPKEFQPRLFKSLQHKLVSTSTQCFEIALYGNSDISDKDLSELKHQLSELDKAMNKVIGKKVNEARHNRVKIINAGDPNFPEKNNSEKIFFGKMFLI